MADLFSLPVLPLLDANGNPLSGALAYFYLTGTTTAAPVYTAADLATPQTQPVVADSAGRFPDIYLNPSTVYAVVLKTAGGSLVRRVDPINTVGASVIGLWSTFTTVIIPGGVDQIESSGYATVGLGAAKYVLDTDQASTTATLYRKKTANGRWFVLSPAQPIHPQMFGAVGDGTTDDTAALQAGADFTEAHGLELLFPDGRYRWTSTYLDNSTIKFRAYSRPRMSETKGSLVGGACIVGSVFCRSQYGHWIDLGVDHGFDTFPSTANDALVFQPQDAWNSPGDGFVLYGAVALGRDPKDAFHGIAVEGHKNISIDACVAGRNKYGIALKVENFNIGFLRITNPGTHGIILKCDPAERNFRKGIFGGIYVEGLPYVDATLATVLPEYALQILVQSGTNSPAHDLEAVTFAIGAVSATQVNRIVGIGMEKGGTDGCDLHEVHIASVVGDAAVAALEVVSTGGGNVRQLSIGRLNANLTTVTAKAFSIGAGNVHIAGGQVKVPSDTTVRDSIGLVGSGAGRVHVDLDLIYDYAATNTGAVDAPGITFDNPASYNSCSMNGRWWPYGVGAPFRPGLSADSIPTTGHFVRGEFVRNTLPSLDGSNMVLMGWTRLTTAGDHTTTAQVSGTDWALAYASHLSPAT